jgi:hypothetical protein
VHNNPAARLHNLVRRLRSTSSNGPPARLWAQALDIPINQEIAGLHFTQVVQGILAFLDLVDETEAGLHELEFDDFYGEAFPPLRLVAHRSFSSLRAHHANLTRPITDETLTLLRVIASEWGKKKPDPKIEEETLQEIQAEAHSLFESVKRAEIDRDLKPFILSLTSAILQAIQQYRIGGPENLKRALALIIGQATLNLELVHKAAASEHTKSLWARFHKMAVKFFELVKFASDTRKTVEAISPFVRLLGGGTGEISPVDLGGPGKQS